MKTRLFIIFFLFAFMAVKGQQNFSYQPFRPRPGDVITITYTPSGDLANITQPVEALFYLYSSSGINADDLLLKLPGSKYTGTIPTEM
jgi:hypothetical protein